MRMLSSLVTCSAVLFSIHAAPGLINPRPIVGAAVSQGSFKVANNPESGTATLLSGDQIQSSATSTKIMLKNGANYDLLPNSTGAFYQDHVTLLDGTMRMSSPSQFAVDSGKFIVSPAPHTEAVIQLASSRLTVNVGSGSTNVTSNGQSLAHMTAGTTLAFDPLEAETNTSNTQVRLLGVLDSENGHYLVRDRFTNSVSEVVGQVSPKLLNHMVMVDGMAMGNQKSDVSQVDRLVNISKLGPSDATGLVPCVADGAGGIAKRIVVDGIVNKIRNHFLVQEANKKTYEVVGDVGDKEIGTSIHSKGFVLPNRPMVLPAEQVVYLENRHFAAMASPCVGAIVGGTLVGSSLLVLPKNQATATAAQVPISF